jgi:hypothetical protein
MKVSYFRGFAMAQEVSCQPLTTEALVRTWVGPCGICGGQSGTGTGFAMSSVSFSHIFPYLYITWGMNNRPVGGRISQA